MGVAHSGAHVGRVLNVQPPVSGRELNDGRNQMEKLTPETLMQLGSVAVGAAVALALGLLLRWMGTAVENPAWSSFERRRRQQLRDGSSVYRGFEALADQLAAWNRGRRSRRPMLDKLGRDLLTAANPVPWLPEEYLAVRQVESGLAALAGVLFGWLLLEDWFAGLLFGGLTAWGYQRLMIGQAALRATQRRLRIKNRLPYAIDLMALMMEAGASFAESLETAVRESRGHPLAEEFGQVLHETALGRTRREALEALQHRLNDEDFAELIFAIVQGEDLGTPLSQILRTQADQMRLKYSQWAEKAAGEAQVAIVFPGMVIMVACLLIVVAPYALPLMFAQ